MIARNQRGSRIASWRDTELESDFGFSPQRTYLVPNFPRIRFPVKRATHCRAMSSKHKEPWRRTDMRHRRLVSSQALSGFFVWSKSLILKEVVGAKGFEPSTSRSRTRLSENLKPCRCRAYEPGPLQKPPSVVTNVPHAFTVKANRIRGVANAPVPDCSSTSAESSEA
jgi:hypothetical protein